MAEDFEAYVDKHLTRLAERGPDTIASLRADNERLRAALEPFANLTIKGDEPDVWAKAFPRFFKLITVARAALEEKQ